MRKGILLAALLIAATSAAPAHAFLDYLFGGSSEGAIESSALGDFRAWWTGNPIYRFNPWYSPSNNLTRPPQPAPGGYGQGGYTMQRVNPGAYPPSAYPGVAQPQYGAPGAQYQPQYGPAPQQRYYQPQAYPAPQPQAPPQAYGGAAYPQQPAYGPPQAQHYQPPGAASYYGGS